MVTLNSVNQTSAREPEWLVLRCPGTETVDYETELLARGLEVWTPVMWIRRRLPRRKIKVWGLQAILPSYLFVRMKSLRDYGGLPYSLKSELIPMSISGRYVVLDDQELAGLREFDNREKPEGQRREGPVSGSMVMHLPDPVAPPAPTWEPGEKVRVLGLLDGTEGTVQGTTAAGEVVVALKNSPVKLKVSGFLLERSALSTG